MNKFKIIADSLCSIPIDIANKYDIEMLQYSINDTEGNIVVDQFDEKLNDQIISEIENKKVYKTSMYSPTLIEQKIDAYIKDYNQVIYVCSSPGFTGQYEATKYIQEKYPNKVFVINSNSTCIFNEEIIYKIIEFYEKNEEINQDIIDEMVNSTNEEGCLLLIPKDIQGLSNSGRIPHSLVKLLKLTKITPIIKVEEKNKHYKIIKNSHAGDVTRILMLFNDIFGKKINSDLIKKIYVVHTLIKKEKIEQIINAIIDFYKIKKERINVRLNPLPISVYTLRDSLGIGLCTNKLKKK